MTDGTRILRTVAVPLIVALIFLFLVPRTCQKAIGSPNVSVGRRAPSRWAAIDSPYGPAPMTTVGCMCLGLQPMAAAIAGHMGTAPRDSTPRPGTRLKSPESGRRPNEPSTPRGRLSPPLGKATIDPLPAQGAN